MAQQYFESLGTSVVPAFSGTCVLSTAPKVTTLYLDMGRCIYCHSVVTRHENSCFTCGDSIPRHIKGPVERRKVSLMTNVAFVSGLAVTAYGFFWEHRLSLPGTLLTSSLLLLIRISAEMLINRNSN